MDIRNIILPTDLLIHSSCEVIVKTSPKDRKKREGLGDKKIVYIFLAKICVQYSFSKLSMHHFKINNQRIYLFSERCLG